jgi:pteridine reductase
MHDRMRAMASAQETRPVALVTGGAKRVGRAIVEELGRAGFDIVFTYLSSEPQAKELETTLRAIGRRCEAIRANLTDPSSALDSISGAVVAQFGRLDVLVNSASLYEPSDLKQVTLQQMRRLNAIHLESPLMLARAFAPLLRRQRGHIVNMVDLLAERPWPQYLGYCVSKAALWSLTLGLARELAPEVTVNGIAPGVVDWPDDYPESEREKYLKRVPLSRPGTPQDVARLVHFLCTSGSYITGQIIRLDGGRSLT